MKPIGYTGLVLVVVGFLAMPVACMVVFGTAFASRGINVVPTVTFALGVRANIDAHDVPNLRSAQNVSVWIDVPKALAKAAGTTAVAEGQVTAKDAAGAVLLDAPLAFNGSGSHAPYVDGGPSSDVARINIHAPVFNAPANGAYVVDVEVHATAGAHAAPPATQAHIEIYAARDSKTALLPMLLPMLFILGGIVMAIAGRRRGR